MAWKGTPKERQQWAIKKRREAEQKAAETGAEPLPGYEIACDQHRCDEMTIEGYGVPPTQTRCRVCGRTWTYTPTSSGWLSVVVSPLSVKMPSLLVTTNTVSELGTNVVELPGADVLGRERGLWWLDRQQAA